MPYVSDYSAGPEDVLSAEGLLIDFNNDRKFGGPGGSNGGGGGGGTRDAPPDPSKPFAYPPPKVSYLIMCLNSLSK